MGSCYICDQWSALDDLRTFRLTDDLSRQWSTWPVNGRPDLKNGKKGVQWPTLPDLLVADATRPAKAINTQFFSSHMTNHKISVHDYISLA